MNYLNGKIVNKTLNHFFRNLKCAAKMNLAFGFTLEDIADRKIRYFFAHENNSLLDLSTLVCTNNDRVKQKEFLNKTNLSESCSREKMNTKWKIYELTNLSVIAASLKNVPMGCNYAVLPDRL